MATAQIKYFLTPSDKLSEIVEEKGNLIFCKDIRTIYLDDDSGRIAYRQIITLPTEASRVALPNPIETFYFVEETCVLWKYFSGEWHQITSTPTEQIVFAAYSEFPPVGSATRLYVDGLDIYRYLNGSYQKASGSFDWGSFH